MIENDRQLHHSVQQLARMYHLRDREAAETSWDPETREDVIDGTDSMIRKIEREIAEYLVKKYELLPAKSEIAA